MHSLFSFDNGRVKFSVGAKLWVYRTRVRYRLLKSKRCRYTLRYETAISRSWARDNCTCIDAYAYQRLCRERASKNSRKLPTEMQNVFMSRCWHKYIIFWLKQVLKNRAIIICSSDSKQKKIGDISLVKIIYIINRK